MIAKESVSDNAYYDPETGYTVIGADALENGINVARKGVQSWFRTAIHEATHGAEKTVAWFGLSNQLRGLEGGKIYNEMLKHWATVGISTARPPTSALRWRRSPASWSGGRL